MSDKITYIIDSTQIVREGMNNLLVISGWAVAESGLEVKIQIDAGSNWMQYRFWRDDVCKEDSQNRCGFYLYIWMERFKSSVNIMFSTAKEERKIVLPIAGILLKQKIKNLSSKPQGKYGIPFRSFNVTKNIMYCLDSIYYNEESRKVAISGWTISEAGEVGVSINGNGNIQWKNREDVVESFKELMEVKKACGFRGEVAFLDQDVICSICMDAKEDGLIYIEYLLDTLQNCTQIDYGNSKSRGFGLKNIKEIYPNLKMRQKYGKEGVLYKRREYDIWNHENDLNNLKYQWSEIAIPDEYIAIQKKQPLISVVSAIWLTESNKEDICIMMESLREQQYKNYEVVFCGAEKYRAWIEEKFSQVNYVGYDCEDQYQCLDEALKQAKGEWICCIEQEDKVSPYFLSTFIEHINENRSVQAIYQDYDICYKGIPQIKVQRTESFAQDENFEMMLVGTCINRQWMSNLKEMEKFRLSCGKDKTVHERRVVYHYNATQSPWNKSKTNIIAFYLTQYHITEENNKWWGEGFTEWRNVRRGVPMFEGHNQPRVPADLGYYDLVEDRSIQYKQIDLAKKYNIYGFCYYYYWFEGKRLLRKPLDQFMENKDLDIPFCICWANETWSKRWDGQDSEILMQQVHNKRTDIAFIQDAIPMFRDERYIRIDGKPLLLIYRINLFPEPYKTIQRWKKICRENGVGDIHVSIVQSFGMVDHRIYGADSSVEFPPHKIVGNQINEEVLPAGSTFSGNIYSYQEIVENLSVIQKRDYYMIPGSMMQWDNTARRMDKSNIFTDFDPELYRRWMIRNHYYAKIYNKTNFTFVNAWNEWAEGTYLEPDEKYGTALLEISREVTNYK